MSKPYMCGDEKSVYIPPSANNSVHTICLERIESEEFEAVYILTIDGEQIGDAIEIPKDTDTWKPNTSSSEGYVASGEGEANKAWMTDAEGNPAWRTVPGGGASIDDVYPVGSVVITSTNTNPSSEFGGSWILINKEYRVQKLPANDYATWNSSITEDGTGYILLAYNRISAVLTFTNKTSLNDDKVEIVRFPWNDIGANIFVDLPSVVSNDYFCDGANTVGLAGMATSWIGQNGYFVIEHNDVVPQGSSGVATGHGFYLKFDLWLEQEQMIDSFCDRFYWKRTA